MNVASLELCKELYELSGWKHKDEWYIDKQLVKSWDGAVMEGDPAKICPAYDLGYLLRKLKDDSFNMMYDEDLGGGGWLACCSQCDQFGKTPEDAACKLAIELFKQGKLK